MRKMSKEIDQLSSAISQLCNTRSQSSLREFLSYILNLMTQETDLTCLAGSVIKLLALPDPPLKKVVYTYLIRYAERISDLNVLATNSILKDFRDPNPYIRRLAIKTACTIPCLQELSLTLLPQALVDTSAFVRRAAVSCCSKVITDSVLIESNQDILDVMYEMIRDPDPTVVASSLLALDEILAAEGGIVINSKIAKYLLNRIGSFHEWSMAVVCSLLKKYKPKSDDEVLLFLDALDEHLAERNPVVFISTTELVLSLVNLKYKHLENDIIERISPQIILLLTSCSSEIVYAMLEFIETMLPEHKEQISTYHKHFLCRFSDAAYVKVKKLSLLPFLINNNNSHEIIDELITHCTDNVRAISKSAVLGLVSILKTDFPISSHCVKTLVQLMDLNYNDLNEEIMKAFSCLDLDKMKEAKNLILSILPRQYHRFQSEDSKVALLWSLGNYGAEIDQSPYILEEIFHNIEDEGNGNMMIALLIASIKLFFCRPAEMQTLLGQILQTAKNSHCPLVRQQASFYYNLLRIDVKLAVKIIDRKKNVSTTRA